MSQFTLYTIYIFDSILETVVILVFLNAFLEIDEGRKPLLPYGFLGLLIFQLLTYFLRMPLLSTLIPSYILIGFLALYFFKDNMMYRAASVHTLIFSHYACRFAAAGAHLLVTGTTMPRGPLPIVDPVTQIFSSLFFLIAGFLFVQVRNLRIRGRKLMYRALSGLTALLMMVSIVHLIHLYAGGTDDMVRYFFGTAFLFYAVAFRSFFYLDTFDIISAEHQYAEMAKEMMAHQKRHFSEYLKLQDEIRKFRHDEKNHFQNILFLLNNEHADEATQYVMNLLDRPALKSQFLMSQNHAIDGVLQRNLQDMEDSGIKVDLSLMIPEKLPFDDVDLCILLNNLLTNAREACEHLSSRNKEKVVVVKLEQRKEFFFIQIKNPYDGEIVSSGNFFLSRKRRYSVAGTGMQNIYDVANKYKGRVSIDTQDGIFDISVLLPFPGKDVNPHFED